MIMKISLLVLSCLVISISGCRKEISRTAGLRPGQLDMTIGSEVLRSSDGTTLPPLSYYQFGGNAGNYFGLLADFGCEDRDTLQIIFGNIITPDYFLTEENMYELLGVGTKPLASLGAFSSYPGLATGASEVAYTDKNKVQWCSTRITEKTHDGQVSVDVSVPAQENAVHIDTSFVESSAYGLNPVFIIKGSIHVTLYEVNGDRRQQLSGKFCTRLGLP